MQATIMKDISNTTNGVAGDVVDKLKGAADPLKDKVIPPSAPSMESVKETMKEMDVTTQDLPVPNGSTIIPNISLSSDGDFEEVVKEIILWQQPFVSGKLLGFVVWLYYSTCSGGYTPVNLICYTLMIRLLCVSGPLFIAGKMENSKTSAVTALAKAFQKSAQYIQEYLPFPSVEQVSFFVKSVSATVEQQSTKAAKALVEADKDIAKLKIVLAHLAVFMVLTSFLSLWNIVFIGAMLILTVPAVYTKYQDKIDPMLEKIKIKAQPHVAKAKEKGELAFGKVKAKTDEWAKVVVAKYNEKIKKKDAAKTE